MKLSLLAGLNARRRSGSGAPPPPASIALVGQKSVVWNGSATNTISLTDLTGGLAAAPAENDLVLVWASVSAGTTNRSLNINTTGYTGTGQIYVNSVNDLGVIFGSKLMSAAPDTSVEITHTTTSSIQLSAIITVLRGVNTSTPIDVAIVSASNTGSATPDPGTITPTTPGALIFVAGASAHTAASDPGLAASYLSNVVTGYRKGASLAISSLVGTAEWTSGAYDPAAFTIGHSTADDSWAAVSVAIRPA